jgi:hypothetical protein
MNYTYFRQTLNKQGGGEGQDSFDSEKEEYTFVNTATNLRFV